MTHRKALTTCKAKQRYYKQACSSARYSSHSQTGEARKWVIKEINRSSSTSHWLESQEQALSSGLTHKEGRPTTHRLKSHEQALSAGLKHCEAHSSLTNWKQCTSIVSRHYMQQGRVAAHLLGSQEEESSAELKHKGHWHPLTDWRAMNRCCQKAWKISSDSHSQTEHPAQELSVGLECTETLRLLTF